MDQEALIGVLSIDSAVLLVLIAESMSSGLIIKLLDDIYRMLWCYSDNMRRLQPQTSRGYTYIELLRWTLSKTRPESKSERMQQNIYLLDVTMS